MPGVFLSFMAFSAPKEGTIKLYQIGKNGRYCVSTSGDESGCISGIDENKEWINILDTIKDSNVEFYNLTDVVHDMRFSGVNAEDMPIQRPGAEAASKTMTQTDLERRSIECSFHGAQVGVGYRVVALEEKSAGHPGASQMANNPGIPGVNPNSDDGESFRSFAQVQALAPTRLADVSPYVLANGNPEEAQWLRKIRPELSNEPAQKSSEVAIKGTSSNWEVGTLNPLSDFVLSQVNVGRETQVGELEEPELLSEKKATSKNRFPSWLIFKSGKYPDSDKYYFEGDTLVLLSDGEAFFNPSLTQNPTLAASLIPSGKSLGGKNRLPLKKTQLGLQSSKEPEGRFKWSWMIFTGLGLLTASRLLERREGDRRKNTTLSAPAIPLSKTLKGSGAGASALLALKKSSKNKAT